MYKQAGPNSTHIKLATFTLLAYQLLSSGQLDHADGVAGLGGIKANSACQGSQSFG